MCVVSDGDSDVCLWWLMLCAWLCVCNGVLFTVVLMADTLALRSPFFAALQREARFPILLVGLHADIVK